MNRPGTDFNNSSRDPNDLPACPDSGHRLLRLHHALRRTGSLLGEDYCSNEWVSEARSSYGSLSAVPHPRARHKALVTQLDRGRRHNPHPRWAALIKARHGQHDVCAMRSLIPEVGQPEVTEKSAYHLEFPRRPVTRRERIKTAPAACHGILPSCRIPLYEDIRQEILLPVEITEKSPSTNNPNKYMARRKRGDESANQHRTHRAPYGTQEVLQPAPSVRRSQLHFVTNKGKPLAQRRHVSAPSTSLTVRGFDGGATQLPTNTMHARLLPFLHGPKII